jgi:1,4-alpha-glucan branching enzyme
MLEYEMHRKFHTYVKTLNKIYLDTPALWEDDGSWDGFAWIYADRSDDNVMRTNALTKTAAALSYC